MLGSIPACKHLQLCGASCFKGYRNFSVGLIVLLQLKLVFVMGNYDLLTKRP